MQQYFLASEDKGIPFKNTCSVFFLHTFRHFEKLCKTLVISCVDNSKK